MRQRIRSGIARERRIDGRQLRLELAGPSVHEGDRLWEYAVRVIGVAYPLEAVGQLYRDRADADYGFDQPKNPWGLSGFTTLYLAPLHGKAEVLKKLIANVGAALRHVRATAELFKGLDRWALLLRDISDPIAAVIGPAPGWRLQGDCRASRPPAASLRRCRSADGPRSRPC